MFRSSHQRFLPPASCAFLRSEARCVWHLPPLCVFGRVSWRSRCPDTREYAAVARFRVSARHRTARRAYSIRARMKISAKSKNERTLLPCLSSPTYSSRLPLFQVAGSPLPPAVAPVVPTVRVKIAPAATEGGRLPPPLWIERSWGQAPVLHRTVFFQLAVPHLGPRSHRCSF